MGTYNRAEKEMKVLNVPAASETEGVVDNHSVKESNKGWYLLVLIVASTYWMLTICQILYWELCKYHLIESLLLVPVWRSEAEHTGLWKQAEGAQRVISHPLLIYVTRVTSWVESIKPPQYSPFLLIILTFSHNLHHHLWLYANLQ